MSTPIVCAECGIRYGDHLDACPWCGRAQLAAPPVPPPPEASLGLLPAPNPVSTAAPPVPAPPPRPTPATNGAARVQPPATAQPAASANGEVAVAAPHEEPVTPPRPSAPEAPAPAQANLAGARPPAEPAGGRWDVMKLRRAGIWVAAALGCLVLGALLAEYAPLGFVTGGGDEPAELQPAVIVTPVDTPDSAPPVQEAAPPPPTAVPSSTAPPPTEAPPAIEPIGEPISLADLSLGVDGIGPLEIGSDADTVLGRLAATFGPPDEDRALVSDGTFSGCPGEAIRVVRWGTLAVTAIPGSQGEVFAGYRVDLGFADGAAGPALETISGLRAGDTVADLEQVYADLDLQFFETDDGAVFELRRPSDGNLLLTGPLTGVDPDSEVRGIYSPDLCV